MLLAISYLLSADIIYKKLTLFQSIVKIFNLKKLENRYYIDTNVFGFEYHKLWFLIFVLIYLIYIKQQIRDIFYL